MVIIFMIIIMIHIIIIMMISIIIIIIIIIIMIIIIIVIWARALNTADRTFEYIKHHMGHHRRKLVRVRQSVMFSLCLVHQRNCLKCSTGASFGPLVPRMRTPGDDES